MGDITKDSVDWSEAMQKREPFIKQKVEVEHLDFIIFVTETEPVPLQSDSE